MRDAKARKRVVESQIADGTYGQVERANMLFTELWAIVWQILVNTLSPAGLQQYGLSYRLRFESFFGHLRLSQITQEVVQAFVNSLSGLSPSYIHSIFGHLRSVMNIAVSQGILEKSPCTGIRLPRLRKTVPPILEPAEVALLVDFSPFPYRALFALLGFTGIRISEALGLQRRHIDFAIKEIQIRQIWDTNCRKFGPPKTDAGIRNVVMLSILEDILREYVETAGPFKPTDLLFPSPDDPEKPLSYTTVYGVFKRGLKSAGLPEVKIHSLRHGFVSVLFASGISIAEITNCVGHSSPEITLRTYTHRLRSARGESFRRANDLFKGDGDGS